MESPSSRFTKIQESRDVFSQVAKSKLSKRTRIGMNDERGVPFLCN